MFVSVFCLVFSIVYESFSHNVYSPYMVFAVAFPLIGFVWVSVWIRQTFELGIWVIFVGIFIGMYCAVQGFVQSMKILSEMHNKNKKKDAPSVFFNDHN